MDLALLVPNRTLESLLHFVHASPHQFAHRLGSVNGRFCKKLTFLLIRPIIGTSTGHRLKDRVGTVVAEVLSGCGVTL